MKNRKQETKSTFSEPFKYHGWELSNEDLDEEAEDLAAEAEAIEDNEAEEEENEEVRMLALSTLTQLILTHFQLDLDPR